MLSAGECRCSRTKVREVIARPHHLPLSSLQFTRSWGRQVQAIHAELKKRHRATREGMPDALNLRIHRALSWLQRASVCESDHDPDARFIFLWIAFNVAYAQEIPATLRLSEQESFTTFLRKLHRLDNAKQLDDLVWHTFSGPIRVLLVFESFWSFQRGEIDEATWQSRHPAGPRPHARTVGAGLPAHLHPAQPTDARRRHVEQPD